MLSLSACIPGTQAVESYTAALLCQETMLLTAWAVSSRAPEERGEPGTTIQTQHRAPHLSNPNLGGQDTKWRQEMKVSTGLCHGPAVTIAGNQRQNETREGLEGQILHFTFKEMEAHKG